MISNYMLNSNAIGKQIMTVYRKTRRKIGACLAAVLVVAILSACGDDTDVIVPAVGDIETQEVPETLVIEETETATEVQVTDDVEELSGEQPENAANAENQTAEAESETEEEPDTSTISITISAAGDVTLGNHHLQDYSYSFRQMYDQVEDAGYFLGNVSDIFSQDDMTIVNLEGVLTLSEDLQEGRTYNIKGDPEYVDILTYGSVEAVSMANNHRWDYGEQGSQDTVTALEGAGIVYAYDKNTGIYETQGIRIGFVSVNEASQGAAVEKILEEGIAKLKEEEVDLILTCCHWGTERENYPEEYQRSLGQKCIDWGADLVIGHHPHVLQGVEEYQGKYIVHSLGNFCFGANRNPADKDTMIFQQTFTFIDGEKQEDQEIRVIPCSVSSVTTRNDFCPTPAEGEDAKRIIGRINEYSKDFGVTFTEEGYLVEESVSQGD